MANAVNINCDGADAFASTMVISATDSGGCAGMQADLRVCASLRVFGVCAVTAVTAQNSRVVADVMPVPPSLLRQQIRCAWMQHKPVSIKIGLLPDVECINAVAETLRNLGACNIVVDPVMSATIGKLMQCDIKSWTEAMLGKIIPLSMLLTPNLPELELLTGKRLHSPDDIQRAVDVLRSKYGAHSILVKGGHGSDPAQSIDYLFCDDATVPEVMVAQKISDCNLRGTGCTLSMAIACYMARGYCLREAVLKAHTYLQEAIISGAGIRYDAGNGPVDHFVYSH